MAGWRLEANRGLLGHSRPDLAHVLLHLRVAADVSARLDLLKEPHGGQRRVLGQSAQDDALVRIHLGRHRRPGPVLHSLIAHVPVQLLGLDPVVNCSTTHAQQLRHSRLRHALLKDNASATLASPIRSSRLHLCRGDAKVYDRLRSRSGISLHAPRLAATKSSSVQFWAATSVQFWAAANTSAKKPSL